MEASSVAFAGLSCTEVLAGAWFFRELEPEQIGRIAALGRIERYPRNNAIYNLGDAAENFYVLFDGMVRFTIGLGSRQTSAGQILRRGEVFGWAALVGHAQKRIATSYCITPCTVVALNGNQLLDLMEHDHSVGYHLMKQLNVLITGNLTSFAAG
ncbi:MAG TPA: cyclic nucleotide-binding domain-containing protein [Burkholderiales bacterium]|nr:cyclic nucleotide-binding domain-containing protein [Burkholderiales bacterium]